MITKKTLLNLVFTLAVILPAISAWAQQADSSKRAVMIIPFDPNMYFSDSDEQLSRYNDKSAKEVRTLFRYGLNINLNAKILSHHQTRPLLTDTSKTAMDDLYAIYKGISYFKDKSMPMTTAEEKTYGGEEKKKLLTFKKKEDDSDAHTTSSIKEPVVRHEYMNVKIHDTRMLPYLKDKYGTDVFVFINQFDLVTNYEHCLDRSTNTFERDIKVHFSILDYNGKQLAGDVAIVHFPSNSNDITEIMRNNFPVIADYLSGKLPTNYNSPVKETSPKAITIEQEIMEFEQSK